MRILNLILYSDNDGTAAHYSMMRDALRPYLRSLAATNVTATNVTATNVTNDNDFEYYFYQFDSAIADGAHEFRGDTLFIGGKETFLPGILDKTIKALQICSKKPYDFVVRSNASSVVNFALLRAKISESSTPVRWAGPMLRIAHSDPMSGLTNGKLFGLHFVSGTCIVMSRDTVEALLAHANEIDRTVIDDVSIAATLTAIGTPITDWAAYWNMWDKRERADLIVYRNRSGDRWLDAANMARIAQQLIEKVDIVTLPRELPALMLQKSAGVDEVYAYGEQLRLDCKFLLSFSCGLTAHTLYHEPSAATAQKTTPLWRINDLIAVSGYYARSFARAAQAARDGLADPELPPNHRDRFTANLRFSEDNLSK